MNKIMTAEILRRIFQLCAKTICFCFFVTMTTGECCGGADDMKRLHAALLGNYNPDVRPCTNYSKPLNITATLHLSTVQDLDIKNQVMKLIGYISFTWIDEQLRWNESDYGYITDMLLPQKKIWRPDMAIYNSVDERVFLGNEETLVVITSRGEVRWEPVINMGLTCKVDISKYPFDQNTCKIDLMSWMNDNTSVNLMTPDDPIIESELIPNGQFWITGGGIETGSSITNNKYYFYITFKLLLKRRPNYLVLTLLIPVTLLAVLCVVSFLLSPEEPEKVSVAITVLLSFTVFLGVVDNDIPETSDNLCLIVAYVVLLLVLSFLCVVGNAVVVVVHKRDVKTHQSSITLHENTPSSAVFISALTTSASAKPVTMATSKQENNGSSTQHSIDQNSNLNGNIQKENRSPNSAEKLSRASRLNKCCLVWNSVALTSIIIVFLILMMY
ncbi:neuronal acetylcholine receptor subunit beta-3-like isoform X1 [Biomphalaria glabrata]|uniref:Neuronal acetylcholine receptor subunit beta-3-like isoform X1 n=2 Tax=Biomphalaria glabrata TaxID=6526 RepID=A0A9W3B7M3_BIOGL|nr:neuronal acetylcholine receptor subunit beta-3-like isoform X1 [Biomphalaria glabrata]